MSKMLIAQVPITIALIGGFTPAQQIDPGQTGPPKVAKPAAPLTFADRMKQFLRRTGSTVDTAKSTTDMVVSNYPDAKGGKITIVLVNDRRRNLVGFYIYNFGSLKGAANKEAVYKYLLEANDSITIGSFFVDNDDDIGYKYLVSSVQTMNQATFDYAYFTMAAVARERKPQIRKLLGPVTESDEKSADVKKGTEEQTTRL